MAEPIGEQEDLALEPARVHGQGEGAGQHFHQQVGAGGQRACDEQAAVTHRPHLALDPVERPERVGESGAELSHHCTIPNRLLRAVILRK